MSIEKQTLLLDYVKTAVIVAGVVFALAELRSTERDRSTFRFENTSKMIQGLGEPDVVKGAAELLRAVQAEPNPSEWNDILVKLTPYKQHLITWSACVEFENCEQDDSVFYLCRILMTYEGGIEILHAKHNRNFNEVWRDQSYFQGHSKCKAEYPALAKQVEAGLAASINGT